MTPEEQQHEVALKTAFAAFATMARAFVQIYATHDPTAPAKLDAAMLDGAFIRIEIGVGGGGPIGAGLYAVRPDGLPQRTAQPRAVSVHAGVICLARQFGGLYGGTLKKQRCRPHES